MSDTNSSHSTPLNQSIRTTNDHKLPYDKDNQSNNGITAIDTTDTNSNRDTDMMKEDSSANVLHNDTNISTADSTDTIMEQPNTDPVTTDVRSNDTTDNNDSNETSSDSNTNRLTPYLHQVRSHTLHASCFKQLLLTLNAAYKSVSGNQSSAYKVRADNIAIKKYIIDVSGGIDVLVHCGFTKHEKVENNKTITYYICDHITATELNQCIEQVRDAADNKTSPVTTPMKSSTTPQSTTSTTTTTQPRTLCINNCGYYGDAQFEGYCSQCYKLKQTGSLRVNTPARCIKGCGNYGSDRFAHMCSACYKQDQQHSKKPVQENKTRCWKCQKKVGITGFECRCNYVFCTEHRYSEQHQCSYDFNNQHKKNLRKQNQQIVGSKLDKIS